MVHANACLTPQGRTRLASAIIEQGWSIRRAAERFQCSPATAKKWADRYRDGGAAAMQDRSSRPHHSPARTCRKTERRILGLRHERRWGPHRIAYHLGIPRSTVQAVLARYRMPLLRHLDQATGLPVRKPAPRRYEHPAPGRPDPPRHQEARPHPRRGRAPQAWAHRRQAPQRATRPWVCLGPSRGR
jgi:transposase